MIPFSHLVSALDARTGGNDQYVALCPAHDDRHASLSFTPCDGGVLFHCFAGCAYSAIVDALERRGLWPVDVDQAEHPTRNNDANLPSGLREFDAELLSPKKGVVQRYLAQRWIDVCALNDIAQHPQAFHAPSGRWWPCMVAAVRNIHGHVASLHRTYLSYTDPPTKAPVEPTRMLWGAARGCAIRLAPAAPTLLIGEGIETTASAMKLLGLPGWSAISAGNMRVIKLPELVREVVIAADNDRVGIAAAQEAAQRLRREGREVRIVKPSDCKDFNDLLLRGGK